MRIIELTEAADATLDAQAEAFDQLRELEKNAPQILETVATEHATLDAKISSAEKTVSKLTSTYGQAAVASITGNVDQARQLAAFVATALGEARTALAKPDPSAAAIAVRGAQQAVGQVGQLLSAVDKVAVDLPALGERLTAATDDTRADIAEARTAEGSAQTLAPSITEAERVLAEAATQDPATALAAVERTNVALNEALSALRDQQAQVARATAQLPRVTAEARGAVDAARDFITTRRGAVGARARTRLAEAENRLTEALALTATDAVAALAGAQQAASLAASALSLAQSEVSSFLPPAYGGSALDSTDSGSGYSDDGSGGAILGGILDALFSGSSSGGSSSGGWGGGGWSSPGGFGGSSSRPHRRPSGGFSRPRSSSKPSSRRTRGGRF